MYIESFKNLIVWQKGIQLSLEIYRITILFPKDEMYGLMSQMRRAAIAIPSNIAEGKMRKTRKDFIQFLRIASGSAAELETQIIIAKSVYPKINYQKTEQLLLEIQKMLTTMIKKMEVPIANN
jgi:four helix bundle protein